MRALNAGEARPGQMTPSAVYVHCHTLQPQEPLEEAQRCDQAAIGFARGWHKALLNPFTVLTPLLLRSASCRAEDTVLAT
jgi:hypothetical protein